MPKFQDLTGRKFGRWLVLERASNDGAYTCWSARCECGTERVVRGANLKSRHSLSCGCWRLDRPRTYTPLTHGESVWGPNTSKEYGAWLGMKSRCSEKSHAKRWYWDKGIRVCAEWRDDYLSFLRDIGRAPAPDFTLERIDTLKGYEPGNVRWATRRDQANNRTNNTVYEYGGVRKTLSEWAREKGINPDALSNRIRRWGAQKVLSSTIIRGRPLV